MMLRPYKPSRPGPLTISVLLMGMIAVSPLCAGELSEAEQGKKLAYDRKKGNCLACHAMDDGQAPGSIGPPLMSMKQRYTDKDKLRDQVHDATKINPASRMPPFGEHHILSAAEIDKIVEYVYSL